jgi:PhzF family phenazine biosynthesis protein
MKLRVYQVDAFAERVFEGNPAAVCPLESWLPDALLQAIAQENNLSETAFFVPEGAGYRLRWFTPAAEVDLCGHATLASASVLYEQLGYSAPEIRFATRSGLLVVARAGEGNRAGLRMTFPATMPVACDAPAELEAGLGRQPLEVLAGFDYVAVYGSEEEVRELQPDFGVLAKVPLRGVIATAPGSESARPVDFVSRFFCPRLGMNEDPVTGSAHCELAPYWGTRLGKTLLQARQVSQRGGSVRCELQGGQVLLTGHARLYMAGDIWVPEV